MNFDTLNLWIFTKNHKFTFFINRVKKDFALRQAIRNCTDGTCIASKRKSIYANMKQKIGWLALEDTLKSNKIASEKILLFTFCEAGKVLAIRNVREEHDCV